MITNGTNASGKKVELNEKEKVTALKRVQQLKTQLTQADDFLTFAKANTDAADAELTIGRDTTKLSKEAIDAAFALEKGQMSDVITGSDGYYIIKCIENNDTDDTQAKKEEIIASRQTKMFKKKYAQWLKNYDIKISQAFWKVLEI